MQIIYYVKYVIIDYNMILPYSNWKNNVDVH